MQRSLDERAATRTVEKKVDERTRIAVSATTEAERAIGRQTRTAVATMEAKSLVAELEREIHAGINSQRVRNGGRPLEWNSDLAAIARAHSDDMTARGYFDHDTPDGLDPTDRLHRAGFSCRKADRYGIAENIAIETTLDTVEMAAIEAVQGWVNSPGHRRNLLSANIMRRVLALPSVHGGVIERCISLKCFAEQVSVRVPVSRCGDLTAAVNPRVMWVPAGQISYCTVP